jgi:PIN domain nuclease of toxin-antitoxin system
VACAAAALPVIHGDAFDRIPVALAHAHTLTILTSDHGIPKYPGVKTLW